MRMGIGRKRSIRMSFSIGAILLLTLFWSVSCGSQGAVEWVNFVQFNGIQYLANYDTSLGLGRALQQGDLGPVFATVQFKLAGNVTTPGYHIKDGDAGDLDAGTPVYTVKGYTPTFRLAAFRQGQLVLYEADDNPRAKTGADLLDIGGKVQSIGVNSWLDSKKQLAAIKDAKEVGDLVEMVLAAPVDHSFSSQGDAAYVIIFYLKDGTTVSRSYFTSTGELLHHILLPSALKTAIEKAVHTFSVSASTDSKSTYGPVQLNDAGPASIGIQYGSPSSPPKITQQQAIQLATTWLGLPLAHQATHIHAIYVLFSDDQYYGTDAKGQKNYFFQNVPAWVVTFEGLNLSGSGGGRPAHGSNQNTIKYNHEMNVLINAQSGEYMEAFTYQ